MGTRRSFGGAIGVAVALALAPAGAGAAPVLTGEHPVGATPQRLTVAADGAAWVAVPAIASDTARVAPDGTVATFDFVHLLNAGGASGMATAPNGRIWMSTPQKVVSFEPANPLATELALTLPNLTIPDDLTFGPDGRLYVIGTDPLGVARLFIIDVTTAPGVLVNPGGTAIPELQSTKGIAVASDGLVYIGDFNGEQVVSINPVGGARVAHPAGAGVQAVGAGPNGQVAYSAPSDTLGRISAAGVPQPTTVVGADSFGIRMALDGAYWAPHFVGGRAVRLTTDGSVSEPIAFSNTNSGPRYVAAGPDGSVWFSLQYPGDPASGRVARVGGLEAPPPPVPPSGPAPGAGPTPPAAAQGAQIGALRGSARVALRRPITLVASTRRAERVRVTIQRRIPGRRSAGAGRCVAPRPSLRRAAPCWRWTAVARVRPVVSMRAGSVRVVVRTGARRDRLAPGRYRIGVRPIGADGRPGALRSRIVTVTAAR